MPDSPRRNALFALLKTKRQDVIDRWSERIKSAIATDPLTMAELHDGIPLFVDELTAALYPDVAPLPGSADSAQEHGAQRLRIGFNVGEVIREYGMLHASILDLARENGVAIDLREQEIVAKWLNSGIADAISQYVGERDVELQRHSSEHLAFIAHEVRTPLSAAKMAFDRLRRRELAEGGRGVELLERSLRRTAEVIDNSLIHASLKMGVLPRMEPLAMRKFLEEIELDAAVEAHGKDIEIVLAVEEGLVVEADARLLRSAISNLLHNALKFSENNTTVTVRAARNESRVTIDVADSCGGLPPGKAEELFKPLVQEGQDRSGFGLGLAIAMQAVEAHNGTIKIRDVPGTGCVFVIDLPSVRR